MGTQSDRSITFLSIQSIILEPLLLAVAVLVLTVFTDSLTPAFLGTALMIYAVSFCVFMIAGRRRVARVVRMYYDNMFYINCKDYLISTFKISLVITAVLAFLLIVFCSMTASLLTGNVKTGLSVYPATLTLPLTAACAVFAGFNEGMHRTKRMIASDLIHAVLTALAFTAAGFFGYRYGAKVDALLYTNDCAGAYASQFAMMAMLLTGLLRFIFQILTARRILKQLSPLHETGKPKYLGEKSPYIKSIWPLMLSLVTGPVVVLCVSAILSAGGPLQTTPLLGIFYGHYLPYIVILGFIGALPCCRLVCLYFAKTQAEEVGTKKMGESFPSWFHLQCIVSFPIGTFLMALAPCIDGGLFLLKDQKAESLLSLGGFVAAFMSMTILFGLLMLLSKRLLPLFFSSIAGLAGALIAAILTIAVAGRDVYGFVAALMVGGLVFTVMSTFMLKVIFVIKGRSLFLSITKPFIAAGLSALCISLVSTGLKYVIGEIPAGLICVFAGMILYLVILSVSRGIEPNEYNMIPCGKLLEKISARALSRRDNSNS